MHISRSNSNIPQIASPIPRFGERAYNENIQGAASNSISDLEASQQNSPTLLGRIVPMIEQVLTPEAFMQQLPKILSGVTQEDLRIVAFSPNLRVTGSLNLSSRRFLEKLPEGLRVDGNLDLFGCSALKALPPGLRVNGNLNLGFCRSLKTLPLGLNVGQDLNLRGCSSLTALPTELLVGRDLDLSRECYSLTELPMSLRVGRNLYLDGCALLKTLPEGLYVNGNLYLDNYNRLRELPERLHVSGNFDLRWFTSLMSLPAKMHIGGNLILKSLENLITLSADLYVGGELDLSMCKSLTTLPEGLHAGRKLDLSGCSSLKEIPPRLHIPGDLDLTACTSLMALPEGLRVDGNLNLNGCSSLRDLPAKLKVGGNMNLDGCSSLNYLPEGLKIGGNLDLSRCNSLTTFYKGIHVGGNVKSTHNNSLTTLHNRLHVDGELDLSWCRSLSALPSFWYVGGDLKLSGCDSLNTIGDGLDLRGNLDLTRCRSLTALPSNITQWGETADKNVREVNLTGTGLSNDLLDRLREIEAPGMRIYFGQQPLLYPVLFSTLSDAISFWKNLLLQKDAFSISLQLKDDQEIELLHFLSRLTLTGDYQNKAIRQVLARRICDVMKKMQEDDEFLRTATLIIHYGMSSCNDRIITALDDLDLKVQIKNAERQGGREELRKLGRGMLMLEEVRTAALAHAATLTWVDEIEIQLAFQIGLKDRLQLPLQTAYMLYRGCAHVSDERIQQVGAEIEEKITDSTIEEYLKKWSPWQKLLRCEAFQVLKPEIVDAPTELDWICSITQHELTEGYLYEGQLYSFATLENIYVETGVDPFTNLQIDLSGVKKLIR